MKVVRRKSSGEIVYRSEPEFEEGKGIANTIIITGAPVDDLAEVEITQGDWDAFLSEKTPDLGTQYKSASTVAEKIAIIAKKLGLE